MTPPEKEANKICSITNLPLLNNAEVIKVVAKDHVKEKYVLIIT